MAPLGALAVLVVAGPMAVVGFVSPAGTMRLRSNVRRNNALSINKELDNTANMHMTNTDQHGTRDGGALQYDRASFLWQQGVLAAGAVAGGVLGRGDPASAAGLFGLGKGDHIELEQVPRRTVIGQTRFVKWSGVGPEIAAMRVDAKKRFKETGTDEGNEVTAFNNSTSEGADVTVGMEVANDSKRSAAIGDGFVASEIAPPGQYLRDDRAESSTTVAWMAFIAGVSKEGYELKQPLSLFEVYSVGDGGKEGVSMYAAVSGRKTEK